MKRNYEINNNIFVCDFEGDDEYYSLIHIFHIVGLLQQADSILNQKLYS